jgi:hypothetical protein
MTYPSGKLMITLTVKWINMDENEMYLMRQMRKKLKTLPNGSTLKISKPAPAGLLYQASKHCCIQTSTGREQTF